MPKTPPAASITSAPESLRADQGRRMRVYTLQMLIRLGCFLAAYFVSGPVQWALIAAAIFLPYFAVVSSNSGRRTGQRQEAPMEYRALPAADTTISLDQKDQ